MISNFNKNMCRNGCSRPHMINNEYCIICNMCIKCKNFKESMKTNYCNNCNNNISTPLKKITLTKNYKKDMCLKCSVYPCMINSFYCIACNMCKKCKKLKESINNNYCFICTCKNCGKEKDAETNDLCNICLFNTNNSNDLKNINKKFKNEMIRVLSLDNFSSGAVIFRNSLDYLMNVHDKYEIANYEHLNIINKAGYTLCNVNYHQSDDLFNIKWILSRLEHKIHLYIINRDYHYNVYNNDICNKAFEKACKNILYFDRNLIITFLLVIKEKKFFVNLKKNLQKDPLYIILFFATGYLNTKMTLIFEKYYDKIIFEQIIKYNNILSIYKFF